VACLPRREAFDRSIVLAMPMPERVKVALNEENGWDACAGVGDDGRSSNSAISLSGGLRARAASNPVTPPNTPLPVERRLTAELGIALGTLRHATQLLRDEGLVVTVPSKGTFICEVDSRRSE